MAHVLDNLFIVKYRCFISIDGASNVDPDLTIPYAIDAHNDGITLFAIGKNREVLCHPNFKHFRQLIYYIIMR